jgi:uncharacterized membrane protein
MPFDLYFLILRIIHILSGVFWVGTAFLLTGFVGPSVAATAPEGAKVLQHMLARTRYNAAIAWASVLTVLSGLILFERVSGGFQGAWMASGTGLVLTVSSLVGLMAFLHATFTLGRSSRRIAELVKEIEAGDGPPSEAQMQEMMALQGKLARNGRIVSLLLLLVVVGMAAAEVV